MWSLRFIETLIQDLRYGARTLLRQPGFTLMAVLTLALGIGSATTIFSAVWNILLNPFPYPDAHRMVAIRIQDTSGSGGGRGPGTLEFLDYQEQNHVFEDIMGATGDRDGCRLRRSIRPGAGAANGQKRPGRAAERRRERGRRRLPAGTFAKCAGGF
jgi:hypothetical protein